MTNRTWMPHLPNFINRAVMYQMESDFGPEMRRTSGHQRRSYNDLQYQMMYTYYVIESPHNYPYVREFNDFDISLTADSWRAGTM